MRSARRASTPPASGLLTCAGGGVGQQGDGQADDAAGGTEIGGSVPQREDTAARRSAAPPGASPTLPSARPPRPRLHRAGARNPEGALRAAVEIELQLAAVPAPGQRHVVPGVVQPGGVGGRRRGARVSIEQASRAACSAYVVHQPGGTGAAADGQQGERSPAHSKVGPVIEALAVALAAVHIEREGRRVGPARWQAARARIGSPQPHAGTSAEASARQAARTGWR